MKTPFVIDNLTHRLADVLNTLLAENAGKPLDITTACLSISGYRLVKDGLHQPGRSPCSQAVTLKLRPTRHVRDKGAKGDIRLNS